MIRPSGPCPAKIMIVGEFPGEKEILRSEPFVGPAGEEMNRMLQEAGIYRSQCFITNVIRLRPPGNDIGAFIAEKKRDITEKHVYIRNKACLPVVADGISLLKREIEMCRPDVIIAFGNVALWALTGNSGIMSWRGSMLQCDLDLALDYKPKVIPTYSPASVLQMWDRRPIVVHDLRRAKTQVGFKELVKPDYQFIIRPSYNTALIKLNQIIGWLEAGPLKLSIDIETRARHIACIGFAWSKLEAICIPLMRAGTSEGYWPHGEEVQIVHLLRQILTHRNLLCVGQNFLYDAQYTERHWLAVPSNVRDTMIAQHSMFSNMQKGLDFLSSMYCEYHEYWKDEGKEWNEKIPEEQYWIYNCKDSVITYEVDDRQQTSVDQMGLRAVHDFQQSMFQPVLRTMIRGVRCDKNARSQFMMKLMDELATRQQWLNDVLGYELNIASPKQMMDLFYVQLKQRVNLNRKTKSPSTDDEAMNTIMAREPLLRPLVTKILEMRSLQVFLSTFVEAPLDIDGRYRCSFNIAGTETYRFTSKKNAFGTGLNLQNIPKGGEDESLELPNVRKLFIPDPGMEFFDIDLGSADLRIVVWEADEPEMKAMLRAGADPYTEIAKEFYNDPTITKKDPRRQTFKAFAHGTNYLGTAKGLAERLGLGVQQAEKTQKWYFGKFPNIQKWQEDIISQVNKRRMVQNVFGYRQYFFCRIEGTVYNQAIAWIPQSTVGCLINRAYHKIYNEFPEIEVLLQVHDSLAGQFPIAKRDWAIANILKSAEIVLPYSDPLIIPVGCKTSIASWGDCD